MINLETRDKVKIAAAHINPVIGRNEENLEKICASTSTAAERGAQLIVFPECALSGYMYTGCQEAMAAAETIPGPAIDRLSRTCRESGVYTVMGMLEKEGDKLFNTAVLTGPQGVIGCYRKVHLPFLGIDRYLDRGREPFRVYATPIGRIGLMICYDINFPEAARSMALQGADILALPTNWPQGREKVPRYVTVTRAFENKVHLAACDRVGEERGARFLGLSHIVNAWGDILAEAGSEAEEIIYAEVSLAEARQKRVVLKPGEFEYDFIHDRQPELYDGVLKG